MAGNPTTLCDGHDGDFVTVTGQILMTVHRYSPGMQQRSTGGSPGRYHRAGPVSCSRRNLHLDLGSLVGFRLLFSFGLGLGFPLKPCGVSAAGLPFGLLRRDALGGLVGLR